MPPLRAYTVAMILITFFFGWRGFLMDLDLVPSWLNWARYGNVYLYGVQLFIQLIFPDDLEFTCVDSIHLGDTSLLGKGCMANGGPASPAVLSGYQARLRHKVNFNP